MKTNFLTLTYASAALEKLGSKDLKISEAVACSRLIKAVGEEMKIFEKQRKDILEKFGTLDKEKNEYIFEKDKLDEVQGAMNELLEVEVKLDFEQIEISSEIQLSAQEVIFLEQFIKFI